MAVKRSARTRSKDRTSPEGLAKKKSAVTKEVKHNQVNFSQGIPVGANGIPMIEIFAQSSELVPVADYASVTIGPFAIRRWVEDTGNLEDIKDRIAECQEIIDRVIDEDRELVEQSIRRHRENSKKG